MSERRSDKIKYGLLRSIEISGFKVFDPVVRLLFGEEPRKQVRDIARFLVTPLLFVLGCLWLWSAIAPRHKTKSGEVPTPTRVMEAAAINHTLDRREDEKEADFQRTGPDRIETIAAVEALLADLTAESERLKEELVATEQQVRTEIDRRTAPVLRQQEVLKAGQRADRQARREAITLLAAKVAAREESPDALLAAIRDDKDKSAAENERKQKLQAGLDAILNDPPKALKRARLASNAVANEVQHLRTRLEILQAQNRSVKISEQEEKTAEAARDLCTAGSGPAALQAARNQVNAESSAERIEAQKYARTATVYFQTKRSLFTVFCGFLMAALIAIPLGIMCGVNRVVMACLTPLISIFKPVSPVVWLLIFQIVIGAFFLPDPEKHPLFLFFGALPGIKHLGVNPALVFCACTVAMCAVWPALVNTALGVSSIDKDHLNVARVLRLNFWSRLVKIIIPSSLPLVFAGLRISLGVGWMVLIAAEALSSSDGLGKFVWDEYQNGSSHSFANIIYACFLIGIIGFFLDRIMIFFQRLVSFDDGATAV